MTHKFKSNQRHSAEGRKATTALLAAMESAMSLETISSYLKKTVATETLSPTAMHFANLAIESVCQKVKLIERLTFAMEQFEQSPQEVVDNGLSLVDKKIEDIWQHIDSALVSLMATVTAKMAVFKSNRTSLQNAIDELKLAAEGFDSQTLSHEAYLPHSAAISHLVYEDKGFPVCAEGVLSSVDSLLVSHASAWSKAIGEQVLWLQNNQAALQANQNVFATMRFDPASLLILNSTSSDAVCEGNDLTAFVSEPLPNSCRLVTHLPTSVVEGSQALDCMVNVSMRLNCSASADSLGARYSVLTINEVKQKAEQLSHTLAKLDEWYTAVYSGIWRDQVFQLMLNKTSSHEQSPNLGSRELKNFVLATLAMMTRSTEDVDDYCFEVCGAMLAYMKASLAQYG
jgi:hypothetical protein